MEIKIESSQVLAVYLALLIFGIGYNQVIAWLERKHYLEGYTALAVAAGTMVTIGLTAFLNGAYALIMLGSFCCSGLPMIIGSIWRHVKAREYEQDASRYHWKITPDEAKFVDRVDIK